MAGLIWVFARRISFCCAVAYLKLAPLFPKLWLRAYRNVNVSKILEILVRLWLARFQLLLTGSLYFMLQRKLVTCPQNNVLVIYQSPRLHSGDSIQEFASALSFSAQSIPRCFFSPNPWALNLPLNGLGENMGLYDIWFSWHGCLWLPHRWVSSKNVWLMHWKINFSRNLSSIQMTKFGIRQGQIDYRHKYLTKANSNALANIMWRRIG